MALAQQNTALEPATAGKTRRERMARPVSLGLRLSSFLIFLFIYLPIIVVAVFSFNNSRFSLQWSGFTTKWYQKILGDDSIVGGLDNTLLAASTQNTLILAVVSTLIATVLGSLLGYGLHRYKFPGSRFFTWFMYIPVVTPDIVMAISLVLMFALMRSVLGPLGTLFELGMPTMIVAHVTFQIAFVAIIVRSRLALLDPALEEAARDLYAGPLETVRYVILPLALPGIVAGALLAFTLSIDDFVISFFTSGNSMTLPILIFTTVKRGITPDINALSTLIVLVTIVAVFAANFLQRSQD
jgi:spermidine/putrescine transport system permease protein